MKFVDLYSKLRKETGIGVIVNGVFERVVEPDEYPDEFMDMEVGLIACVGNEQMNVYLVDNTKRHLLDTDDAEGKCLGDIVD